MAKSKSKKNVEVSSSPEPLPQNVFEPPSQNTKKRKTSEPNEQKHSLMISMHFMYLYLRKKYKLSSEDITLQINEFIHDQAAKKRIFDFGQHKNRSAAQVLATNPNYLSFCVKQGWGDSKADWVTSYAKSYLLPYDLQVELKNLLKQRFTEEDPSSSDNDSE